MLKGYNILVALQVIFIGLIIIGTRQHSDSFAALHGWQFAAIATFVLLTISVLFFIKPFRPEKTSSSILALVMNLFSVGYLWYAWYLNNVLMVR
jgi:hypothetical protein